MDPPPASPDGLASRPFAGSMLRVQPDRRLVSFRDGYASAFEEIVRRYWGPLKHYASALVAPRRAEDVTQDAFSKAFVALRGTDSSRG